MNLNKLMILALPLMIGCIIVGCGGAPSESDLIGKWELDPKVMEKALKDEGLEGEGLEMALKRKYVELFSEGSLSITFEFKEDGTLMVSFGESESESGEWKLDGSTLKTRQGQEDWEQIEISLSGDELVMKKGEESLGFKRVK